MNPVVMRLALRSLLGSRRVWILLGLSGLLLAVAGLTRWGSGGDPQMTAAVMTDFGLGLLVPVMCLLIGTGVMAPEIEDGSVVYVLAKPLSRTSIVLSKLVAATAVALVLTVGSVVAGTLIAGDDGVVLAGSLGTATALACIAYTAVFFTLAVVTRNSTIVGLIYALLWEGVIAGYVPGANTISIRQWALAPAERMLTDSPGLGISSDVNMAVGLILIVVTTVGATALASRRLARLSVRVGD